MERIKNNKKAISSALVAECVGCSEVTVRMIRYDQRSDKTELGQKIKTADLLLTNGINDVIQNVKQQLAS